MSLIAVWQNLFHNVGLLDEFVGKKLFVRGVSADLKEKHMIKFFKKNGIAVESVELANGKS